MGTIRVGRARCLYRQGLRIRWYLVKIGEVSAIAVFDRHRDRINTFLGMEALSDIGLRLEDVA